MTVNIFFFLFFSLACQSVGAAGLASSTTAGIFGASTAAGGAAGYFSEKGKGNDNDDTNDEDDIKKNDPSNIVNLPCGCILHENKTKKRVSEEILEVDGKIKSKMVTYLFCPTHDGSFVKVWICKWYEMLFCEIYNKQLISTEY